MTHGHSGYVLGCRCNICVEGARTYRREHWRKHRERYVDSARVFRRNNPDKVKAYHARYRAKHRDAISRRHRAWRVANPEAMRQHRRRYWLSNREAARENERRYRARKAAVSIVPFTVDQLLARWDYYGGRCWMCGAPATANDHVKPISRGGPHMLSNIRPACTPCNTRKRDQWPFPLARQRERENR